MKYLVVVGWWSVCVCGGGGGGGGGGGWGLLGRMLLCPSATVRLKLASQFSGAKFDNAEES